MTDTEEAYEGRAAVSIHPLVLVNISDHHTRWKSLREDPGGASTSGGSAADRVCGILLGVIKGEQTELMHSFELKLNADGSFDDAFKRERLDQYKQVFPDYEVVGWYACDLELEDSDIDRQRDISTLAKDAVFFLMKPSKANSLTDQNPLVKNLPFSVYKMDSAAALFREVDFVFASSDSERVAVDHVIQHAPSNDSKGTSLVVQHLVTLHRAVSMLNVHMEVVQKYLEATARGEVPWHSGILRHAAEVCTLLPSMKLDSYSSAVLEETDNERIVAFLTGVTKILVINDEIRNMYKNEWAAFGSSFKNVMRWADEAKKW
eukprot:CAMPEP_0198733894 /NCGR_PEP_ID=MMETSP1475-20131203/49016_1 /TAXON_ID= ORGANISM="Unidentified sp., Strain CCMP1999" /NCGR_SAMPLE_ID=MMETSP1475 /ASSEMBLY_ACC=CAM_ASM_001111 /LENGTH=318 /DNA_ID=CAMNT_0044497265 /DNA_START=74 /DNA_END=1027 /DNA_ORIENTATION=+